MFNFEDILSKLRSAWTCGLCSWTPSRQNSLNISWPLSINIHKLCLFSQRFSSLWSTLQIHIQEGLMQPCFFSLKKSMLQDLMLFEVFIFTVKLAILNTAYFRVTIINKKSVCNSFSLFSDQNLGLKWYALVLKQTTLGQLT